MKKQEVKHFELIKTIISNLTEQALIGGRAATEDYACWKDSATFMGKVCDCEPRQQ